MFTHSLELGGAQLWLYELLRLLTRDHGYACTVVAPGAGDLADMLEAVGVRVRTIAGYPVDTIEGYEAGVQTLDDLIKVVDPDSVLVNTLGLFPAAEAAMASRKPVLWAIHENWTIPQFEALVWDVLPSAVRHRWNAALRAASAITFVCEASSALYQSEVPASRRLVIPYGIDLAKNHPRPGLEEKRRLRRQLGLSPDAVVLLSVAAQLERRKGQLPLAEAFRRIVHAHPQAMLVLLGQSGADYGRAVQALIAEANLSDRVLMVPLDPHPQRWYAVSDAYVCASYDECMPRTVVEAFVAGLPVLATSVGGLAELITDRENGWLVQPYDLTRLSLALSYVLALSGPQREMVGRAAASSAGDLDSSLYAADIASVLAHLVATGEAPAGEAFPLRHWRAGAKRRESRT